MFKIKTYLGITKNEDQDLFDDIEVKDISGNTVYSDKNVETFDESGNTITSVEKIVLTYPVPRMVTKIRDKYIEKTIPDSLDLNTGQIYAAMYGALQKTMGMLEDALERIEVLEKSYKKLLR